MSERDPGFHLGQRRPPGRGGAEDTHAPGAHASGPHASAAHAPADGRACRNGRLGARQNGFEDTEEVLRRLLRDTVSELEPSPDSLTQLRLAVPARRRRRRQLVVGVAASVVLLGVGAPLMVHTAATAGGDGGTLNAGGGSDLGEDDVGGTGGLDGTGLHDAGGATQPPLGEDAGGGEGESDTPSGGAETTEGASESGTTDILPAASDPCTRSQLGEAETVAQEPDASGQIYGAFRLVNVSSESCVVAGSGELAALPYGGTTTADVQVVQNVEGGAATALPEPVEPDTVLLLTPGTGFEVRFAYVPETGAVGGGCTQSGSTDEPTTDPTEPSSGTGEPTRATVDDGTGSPDPAAETGGGAGGSVGTPDGGGTGDSSAGANGDPDSGAAGGGGDTGDNGGSEPTVDSGVVLEYIPAAGEPGAQVTLPGVCSGTVYHTGVLQTSAS
ncbi:hypothetical protein ACTWP5_30505 [Streptomyces sp. 4N509B]|uniref:hypothetical protein n=1 Tax=Streptomyces sp. 4N509B TaxID=3457413 RepID=UPI003FD61278